MKIFEPHSVKRERKSQLWEKNEADPEGSAPKSEVQERFPKEILEV